MTYLSYGIALTSLLNYVGIYVWIIENGEIDQDRERRRPIHVNNEFYPTVMRRYVCYVNVSFSKSVYKLRRTKPSRKRKRFTGSDKNYRFPCNWRVYTPIVICSYAALEIPIIKTNRSWHACIPFLAFYHCSIELGRQTYLAKYKAAFS